MAVRPNGLIVAGGAFHEAGTANANDLLYFLVHFEAGC